MDTKKIWFGNFPQFPPYLFYILFSFQPTSLCLISFLSLARSTALQTPFPSKKGFSSCLLPRDELHPELGLPPHHVHVAVTLPVDTLAHELEVVLEVELGKDEGHFEFGETIEKKH